jgi:hypothetical protein
MPCLDPFGVLTRLLATAIFSASDYAPQKLILFGHASDEIHPEFNFDLSHRRGLALRALILQDSLAWKLAAFGASIAELSLTLSGIAATMGWDCDTNQRGHLVANTPSDALRVFQTRCIHRYRSPQQDNGLPSVVCWHGVYCVLTELVSNYLKAMNPAVSDSRSGSWSIPQLGYEDGLGVFPCGANFSASGQSLSCQSRHVDLIFLPNGIQLPERVERTMLLTPFDVAVYDESRFILKPRLIKQAGLTTYKQEDNL